MFSLINDSRSFTSIIDNIIYLRLKELSTSKLPIKKLKTVKERVSSYY